MRWNRPIVLAGLLASSTVVAQEYKVEVLKEPAPAALSAGVKGALNGQGYRILDDQGKSYAEFWLRKEVPASGKPDGPKGAVQFPVLAAGELLGAFRFVGEGHDYRDQTIPQGTYTLRYGLQPVNGAHLGVSPYRDYALLLPAAKDPALTDLAQKKLEEGSAEAAGTSHPAVLLLLAVPKTEAKPDPSMIHDEAKNTWGAVVPLKLAAKGSAEPATLHVQLVVVGASMN